MVFDGLTWNTSPGACEVEPPVSGRGPWSTTVTRSQPRVVSSSARLAPTIPAPMMTTRGVLDIALLLTCRLIWGPPTGWSAVGGGGLEAAPSSRSARWPAGHPLRDGRRPPTARGAHGLQDPDRWSGRGRHGRAQLAAPPGEQPGLVHPEDGDRLPVALVDHQEAAVG